MVYFLLIVNILISLSIFIHRQVTWKISVQGTKNAFTCYCENSLFQFANTKFLKSIPNKFGSASVNLSQSSVATTSFECLTKKSKHLAFKFNALLIEANWRSEAKDPVVMEAPRVCSQISLSCSNWYYGMVKCILL